MPSRPLLLLLLLPSVLLATAANAEVRHGAVVIVEVAELIEGNLYVNGGDVIVHGRIKGDVIVAGATVTIDGTIDGDILVVARDVAINATVLGDVRIAAASASVRGRIEGDIAVTGGVLDIDGRARGALFVFGSDVDVAGHIGGDVFASTRSIVLEAEVDGDVVADGGGLRLGDHAIVHGELRSNTGIERAPAARIIGAVSMTPTAHTSMLWSALRSFVGFAAIGFIWRALSRRRTTRAVELLRYRPLTSLVAGLVILVSVPVLLVSVFTVGIFVGGWWLSLIGVVLFGLAMVSTVPLMSAFLSSLWLTPDERPIDPAALEDPDFEAGTAGPVRSRKLGGWLMVVALLSVMLTLPLVGVVVGCVVVVFGLGAMFLSSTHLTTKPVAGALAAVSPS